MIHSWLSEMKWGHSFRSYMKEVTLSMRAGKKNLMEEVANMALYLYVSN